MAGKRGRKSAEAEGATAASAASSKSPMEESADALAGVEGALTGSKRKASATAAAPGPASKKNATTKGNETAGGRARSNSIEQLAEVAGSLLKDATTPAAASLAAAAAAAGATSLAAAAASVPDPMAASAAEAASPTGFRKKGGAVTKASATTKSKAPAAAANPESKDDGKKKTQITYNPDIPMTKEQLTAWRREMRRVRNRESAAASRRKVRDRIEELEDEVAVWKKRYHEVVAKLERANDGEVKRKRKSKGGGEGKDDGVQV